jgi:hypothetical protein
MARKRNALIKEAGSTPIQGFAPDPTTANEFIIGTSAAIDTTTWMAMRWSSKDGFTPVTRKLNGNASGTTGLAGVDILRADVIAVTFTGTAGTVVEYELM